MIRGPGQDHSLFAVPADDGRAAELALRDARDRRNCVQLHGLARRRMDRERLAATIRLLETRIIETADALLARAARSCA